AGDDSFWTWREVMYRFLDRMTPEDVEAIAALAFKEMLEGGFTAVAEFHYVHHDEAGRPYADIAKLAGWIVAGAAATGIGLTLLPVLYCHANFGDAPPVHGQRRFVNRLDAFARLLDGARKAASALPGTIVGVAPHSLRAVGPAELAAVTAMVPEGPIHIHVAEQMREVEDCVAATGQRPVAWLLDNAPVDARWCLIHATHIDDGEIAGIAASGAVAGLCPLTEASLGDGIFPAEAFVAAGGRLGVGSDSNIEITAPGGLRHLERARRLSLRRRTGVAGAAGRSTGATLYDAALRGGAQALGQPVGGIAPGHRADFVVLDAGHPALAGMSEAHWLDAYLFAGGKDLVDRVIVGGSPLVEGGRHRDDAAITARYIATVRRLAAA
ncbi:MAG TPA: formimidoylglutamate deiminase, partial [Bauldia sp.]|nr:formimidoylglutamate deiminase [Bauldia sp.]